MVAARTLVKLTVSEIEGSANDPEHGPCVNKCGERHEQRNTQYETRELTIDELDAVTGGGGDCTGPGIGMGGLGHAIKQVVGAVVNVAGTILGML